jgi:ParE toxin of type II toxin-antitoxin system, parDE
MTFANARAASSMSQLSVKLHPEAQIEYLEALRWYREQSLVAAHRFETEFNTAIGTIRAAPERWAEYFDGSRRFLLHRFPFGIIYESSLGFIFVIAVAHVRRRPGYWKDRR